MSTLQATDRSTKATDKQYNSFLLLCSHLARWPCVVCGARPRFRGCAVRCVRALVGACSALLGMGRGKIACDRMCTSCRG